MDGLRSCQKYNPIKLNRIENIEFYSTIDPPTQQWINSLQNIWNIWKKSTGVSEALYAYFETAPNPYLSNLRILVNVEGFYNIKTKNSLPFTVVEDFISWMQPRKQKYESCLYPEIKLATFALLIKQKNMQLLKLVSDIYELPKDNQIFINYIDNMVEGNQFKEATQICAVLDLQSMFGHPETLLLPLLLQSKHSIVEDFLKGYPELQLHLVSYLDKLLDPNCEMIEYLNNYISEKKITDVKMPIGDRKALGKLVARLAKCFNLSPSDCPFLHKRRGEGYLQFLIHKRYIQGGLSKESMREMAKETLEGDSLLHEGFVRSLANHDTNEALYFAKMYSVPKTTWPWGVLQRDEEIEKCGRNFDDQNATTYEEIWDAEDDIIYHDMKLPRENIQIIDNAESFENFLYSGLNNVYIVGIDSEWKPNFSIQKAGVALIQIATHSHVYILDVISLGGEVKPLWIELGTRLFNNKNILKLGFGFNQDAIIIKESISSLAGIRTSGEGYLDLSLLWKRLVKIPSFTFPYKGDENFLNETLSKLVEVSLGHRLNKVDQFSNWERRPLREEQIIYAALDAYCLLEIYNVLVEQCDRLQIPFHDICVQTPLPTHKTSAKVSDKLNKEENFLEIAKRSSSNENVENDSDKPIKKTDPINAHQWRVVCDSMLGGLSKYLRMCGVDCIFLNNDRGGELSAKLALEESRVMLTQGTISQRYKNLLPEGYFYKIEEIVPENQLKEVFSVFNIFVHQKDVKSRCVVCNKDEFCFIFQAKMKWLNREYGNQSSSNRGVFTKYYNNENNSVDQVPEYFLQKSWHLNIDAPYTENCTTKYNKRIQIEKYPNHLNSTKQDFIVCENCGKIYWENSDFENRTLQILKDILINVS